ncbi:acyl-CoA N-acyltransferase [Podospora conica]|nr:acyl-CoA N-acyltransferase [Schizothecium conicum]
MSYSLRFATEADAEAITNVNIAAFGSSGNKAHSLLFPKHLRTPTSDQDIYMFRAEMIRPLLNREKHPERWNMVSVFKGDDGVEEIAGYSHWETPAAVNDDTSTKNQSVEERIAAIATRARGLPTCLDTDALAEFMRAAERLMKDTIGEQGDKDMWTLGGLGVSPKHQRKGVGAALVRWGLERAKEDGRDTYLIATAPGRTLYLGLGFKDVGEERELLGEPHRSMIKAVDMVAGGEGVAGVRERT